MLWDGTHLLLKRKSNHKNFLVFFSNMVIPEPRTLGITQMMTYHIKDTPIIRFGEIEKREKKLIKMVSLAPKP